MAHIVIMGAGIGGMPAAYEMRDMLPKEHKITVVSALDYFQFVPSNPWVAVGWRKREDVILQIAPLLERKGIGFIAKPVTKIDAEASKLELDGGQTLATRLSHWRVLWCAAGSGHALFAQSDVTDGKVRVYSDNAAVARQMDRGVALEARLAGARQNRNRSVRLEIEVVAPLQ